MGLLSGLLNTAVDLVTLPIAVVEDCINVVEGDAPDTTVEQLKKLLSDLK